MYTLRYHLCIVNGTVQYLRELLDCSRQQQTTNCYCGVGTPVTHTEILIVIMS